jgi:antigen flippase
MLRLVRVFATNREMGYQILAKLRRAKRGRSTSSDYILTFLATGLIQGLGIITGVLTARLLGPAGKGSLATVLWLPSLMNAAGILALPQAVTFEVSRHPEQEGELTAAGFWLSLGLGVIEAAILYPLVPMLLGPTKQSLVSFSRLILPILPMVFPGLVLLGIHQGRQKFSQYNLLRVSPIVVYVSILLLLWSVARVDLFTVIVANLFAQGITTIWWAGLAGKNLMPGSLASWWIYAKGLVKRGGLFHIPALSGVILLQTDMALLVRTVSVQEVGYYSVALSFAVAQLGLATSLVQVTFPKAASVSPQEAPQVLLRHFRLAQLLVLGMAVVMMACSPWLIRLLFGPSFLPASPLAFILIVAMAFWGLNQILDNGLRSMGHSLPGGLANGIALVVLVVTGIVLVQNYHAQGIAFAVLLSQICALLVLLANLRYRASPCSWRELWGFDLETISHLLKRRV